MIRKLLYTVLAVALASALGWQLAETAPAGSGFSATETLSLPEETTVASQGDIDQSLALLYRRSAWSAVTPESESQAEEAPEEVAAPEGLDRFRLLGILRVKGVEPEALLRDLNAGDDRPAVFRAREGDKLQDTGVILAAIGPQRISLEQSGEARELFLFPQSPTDGRDQ